MVRWEFGYFGAIFFALDHSHIISTFLEHVCLFSVRWSGLLTRHWPNYRPCESRWNIDRPLDQFTSNFTNFKSCNCKGEHSNQRLTNFVSTFIFQPLVILDRLQVLKLYLKYSDWPPPPHLWVVQPVERDLQPCMTVYLGFFISHNKSASENVIRHSNFFFDVLFCTLHVW